MVKYVHVRPCIQDMPPSVANETSSKRRSYSLLEAQQQYPMQQHGIAVRQSYISTAPVSLQAMAIMHLASFAMVEFMSHFLFC